jgi:hypothetical protein
MTPVQDHYETYYADKLWNLLPAIYRSMDSAQFNVNGPLREMVNRIGVQAAILRRSIDRLWEDQSIESCDDWLIPYIGALVATNLVSNLDARAQRLDVASTIYYRQRKGTLGLLEQLAFNITGWNARTIEFFRRLGRTRHGLDPAIGQSLTPGDDVSMLQRAEGLVGPLTRTAIGGSANLRNVYGASKVGSAFDEYFHTADFRFGQGMVGWYNIPRLGVFLWRLKSYGVAQTTPVPVTGCPGWYTFDPTGRDVPLFAAARETEQYGANWISPTEEQLPGPISQTLYNANTSAPLDAVAIKLYPGSLAVWPTPVPPSDDYALTTSQVTIRPERGRFLFNGSPPLASPPNGLWDTYHYGFSSEIGAGPYDRRLVRTDPTLPAPQFSARGGAGALATAGAIPSSGSLSILDSLTYDGVIDVAVDADASLTLFAGDEERPLIRLPAPSADGQTQWIITGNAGSKLTLDGLFISGGDVVIRGTFANISVTCCTLDPGTAVASESTSPPNNVALSADGRALTPTRLWIEAAVEMLTIGNCIIGPLQTRSGGTIQTLCIDNSILQALPGSAVGDLASPLSPPENAVDAALLLEDGDASLTRCTVLGQLIAHRLSVSESILQDLATVDDTQHGCVRFTAWTEGSVLPQKYESVQVRAQAQLFTSTHFGNPGYCQLLASADLQIAPDSTLATQNTISAGAQDGSEMGAFAREQNPQKARGLLIKFQEYMPAGLIPVIVYVT